jgi:hypothetical protein
MRLRDCTGRTARQVVQEKPAGRSTEVVVVTTCSYTPLSKNTACVIFLFLPMMILINARLLLLHFSESMSLFTAT